MRFTRAGPGRRSSRNPRGRHSCVIPVRCNWIPSSGCPTPNQYSVGLDREVGRWLAVSVAYVRKDGRDFIGWKELAGEYRQEPATLNDGRVRAGLEADHPFGGTSLSADESRGLLAEVQRSGHHRRATKIPRLAGIRVLHPVEGVRPAALERDDRGGPAGRDRGLPASLVRARASRSGRIRTISPTPTAACPTIARTWFG